MKNLVKLVPWIFENCQVAFRAPLIDATDKGGCRSDNRCTGESSEAKASLDQNAAATAETSTTSNILHKYDLIQSECAAHVEECYSILLKLLANKTIEYVQMLLPELISQSAHSTIEKRLRSFTGYLVDVYEIARVRLYPEGLTGLFTELWKQISECFRGLIEDMFDQNRTYPAEAAETLLQTISYLVKFSTSLEAAGLELDFLTNEMEDNVFLLR